MYSLLKLRLQEAKFLFDAVARLGHGKLELLAGMRRSLQSDHSIVYALVREQARQRHRKGDAFCMRGNNGLPGVDWRTCWRRYTDDDDYDVNSEQE